MVSTAYMKAPATLTENVGSLNLGHEVFQRPRYQRISTPAGEKNAAPVHSLLRLTKMNNIAHTIHKATPKQATIEFSSRVQEGGVEFAFCTGATTFAFLGLVRQQDAQNVFPRLATWRPNRKQQ